MFNSDSTNKFNSDLANIFTSASANMFTSDLASMFTSESGVQLPGWRVGGGLPWLFLKIKKSTLILQKTALILEKCTLFVCIYGLNSHLKCCFKSILEKRHQFFFPAGPSFCVSYMKRLSKCPYYKEPPLSRKIPGYAPVTWPICWPVTWSSCWWVT